VRMVRSLQAELGHDQGTVHRVATQLGYGVESCGRGWPRPATKHARDRRGTHPPSPQIGRARFRAAAMSRWIVVARVRTTTRTGTLAPWLNNCG